MPELPEVEEARRAVEAHCACKKIIKAIIADDSKVIDGGVSPKDFEASLLGKTIVAAHRKGKNMWIQLDSPPFPSFQGNVINGSVLCRIVTRKSKVCRYFSAEIHNEIQKINTGI